MCVVIYDKNGLFLREVAEDFTTENNKSYEKPGRERSFRGKYQVQDMNSDSEEDILVDDWLIAKQALLHTSDEELNDDLLRSDEENETMRCHDESISKPKLEVTARPYLVCKTSHLAGDQARCATEGQKEVEVDPGEVVDIEINAPPGDEFQSGAELEEGLIPQPSGPHLMHPCRELLAPEETHTGPCCSPGPVYPGQHMFDQQHSASVLDTNPLLSGPAPMGFHQPPGNESDPWRPSPALQGPMDLSSSDHPHCRHNLHEKHPSAQSGSPFIASSGPQAKKPAVLVRAVARMGQSAKPMAVARGMPIAARQPASAKSTISAKTPPAPGMVVRNVGQKVKEEVPTPPATQKRPTKPLNIRNNEESEDELLYMQRLNEQIQLREQIIRQKEQSRFKRAINNQKQVEISDQPLAQDIQQIDQRSFPRKVTHQQLFLNTPHCPVLKRHPEFQPLPPQQHQYHVVVPAPQPPWQQAPAARGNPSGLAAGLQHNQPHLWGTDRVILQGMKQVPDQRNQMYANDEAARVSEPQEVWRGGRRVLEQRDSESHVPAKIRVVKHYSPGATQKSVKSDLTPQTSEESTKVVQTKPRIVTFRRPVLSPPSFLQHGLRPICPNQRSVFAPNQPQVTVRGNECCAFIPLSSSLNTEPVTTQTSTSFIVRLNH